jgi:glucosamine-6-phosphate deaminase
MPIFRKKSVIKFVPCINPKEIGDKVSTLICDHVKKNKRTVLGFSAGITVKGLYDKIVLRSKKYKISFEDVVSFNTDEYIDIDKHYQRYSKTNFMRNYLFSKIDIDLKNTNFPSVENYKTYDKRIQKMGGIDLLILTVGPDGYIAFNEPGTKFNTLTHIGELQNNTRTHLMDFFDEKINVPYETVTMGIRSILNAKKIILLAAGPTKAAAISKLFENKYSNLWPLTALLYHKNVTVYADIDACKLMQE